MFRPIIVMGMCCVFGCLLHAQNVDPILKDLMKLHPNWITRSVTSHDPTGGNGDGSGNGIEPQGEYKVLFHGKGEGRITRIWMTADLEHEIYNDWEELWIKADGHTIYKGNPLTFFQGGGPFPFPTVMDFKSSSGGFLSYAPISYHHEAKVLLKGREHYFQVTSREGDGASHGPTLEQIQNFLTDTWWEKIPPPQMKFNLPKSQPVTIMTGPALVSSISIQVLKNDLKKLMIQVGSNLEVPLEFYFGLATSRRTFQEEAQGWRAVRSSLHFVDPISSTMISRIPVPLQAGEVIKVRSLDPSTDIVLGVQSQPNPPDGVHLAAQFKEQDGQGVPTTMSFFESAKPVQFVGVVESIEGGRRDRIYLEGDEMIRTNGMSYPLYLGTGTEDFFNGGWYFRGPHSNPMSGEPLYIEDESPVHSLYRYMIFDPIVSLRKMRLGFETGETGSYQPILYRTLSFGYEFDGPNLLSHFAVEASKMHFSKGQVKIEKLNLDAEANQAPVSVDDLWSEGLSTVDIPCFPQTKRLQVLRTFNDSIGKQEAEIFINDDPRGHFYEAVKNSGRALSQDIISLKIKKNDCTKGSMNFKVKSRRAFSSIQYEFNYY